MTKKITLLLIALHSSVLLSMHQFPVSELDGNREREAEQRTPAPAVKNEPSQGLRSELEAKLSSILNLISQPVEARKIILELREKDPDFINTQLFENGNTLLHELAIRGSGKGTVFKYAIINGLARTDIRNNSGQTVSDLVATNSVLKEHIKKSPGKIEREKLIHAKYDGLFKTRKAELENDQDFKNLKVNEQNKILERVRTSFRQEKVKELDLLKKPKKSDSTQTPTATPVFITPTSSFATTPFDSSNNAYTPTFPHAAAKPSAQATSPTVPPVMESDAQIDAILANCFTGASVNNTVSSTQLSSASQSISSLIDTIANPAPAMQPGGTITSAAPATTTTAAENVQIESLINPTMNRVDGHSVMSTSGAPSSPAASSSISSLIAPLVMSRTVGAQSQASTGTSSSTSINNDQQDSSSSAPVSSSSPSSLMHAPAASSAGVILSVPQSTIIVIGDSKQENQEPRPLGLSQTSSSAVTASSTSSSHLLTSANSDTSTDATQAASNASPIQGVLPSIRDVWPESVSVNANDDKVVSSHSISSLAMTMAASASTSSPTSMPQNTAPLSPVADVNSTTQLPPEPDIPPANSHGSSPSVTASNTAAVDEHGSIDATQPLPGSPAGVVASNQTNVSQPAAPQAPQNPAPAVSSAPIQPLPAPVPSVPVAPKPSPTLTNQNLKNKGLSSAAIVGVAALTVIVGYMLYINSQQAASAA